jgi:hypothetical protein
VSTKYCFTTLNNPEEWLPEKIWWPPLKIKLLAELPEGEIAERMANLGDALLVVTQKNIYLIDKEGEVTLIEPTYTEKGE